MQKRLVDERIQTPLKTTVSELQFSDDTALVGSSREALETVARALDKVASQRGQTLSIPKTKLLVAGRWSEDGGHPITIRGEPIDAFKYLRSAVTARGEDVKDVEQTVTPGSKGVWSTVQASEEP